MTGYGQHKAGYVSTRVGTTIDFRVQTHARVCFELWQILAMQLVFQSCPVQLVIY